MQEMSKKVKAGPITACAMSIFALAALLLFGSGPRGDLSIVFAGYANSATGVPSANFIVSNAASRVLFVSRTGIVQQKNADEWKNGTTTNRGVSALLPNQTFIVTISRPTNCEAWRIFLTSGRPRGSFRRRIGSIYEQQPLKFEPLSYLLLSPVLRHTITYSEEITN
jgi:hypothetical protein